MLPPEERGVLERLYLALHHRRYAQRLKSQQRFPERYVVSIGNLSAGGTGKTPATRLLAEHSLEPLIVLRGYGGSLSARGGLVAESGAALCTYREAGDEAILLAETTGARVAVGRDRAAVISRFAGPSRTVLLDDAFQNPSVYRDHELVLLDASAAPQKLRPIPCGRLRDDWPALGRAHTVLLTRVSQASAELLAWLRSTARRYVSAEAIFESDHTPQAILPPLVRGQALGAFAGIARPEAFFDTLRDLGHPLEVTHAFADHHSYSPRDLLRLSEEAERHNLAWVTTEKDAVRIRGRRDAPQELLLRLHVLPIALEIRDGRLGDFLSRVLGPARRRP